MGKLQPSSAPYNGEPPLSVTSGHRSQGSWSRAPRPTDPSSPGERAPAARSGVAGRWSGRGRRNPTGWWRLRGRSIYRLSIKGILYLYNKLYVFIYIYILYLYNNLYIYMHVTNYIYIYIYINIYIYIYNMIL